MSVLTPTPVTLENLMLSTSAINIIDAAAAQEVSPRFGSEDWITVAVTDDPWVAGAFWTQKSLGGEWIRDAKLNNNVKDYTLVSTTVVQVNMVVTPVANTELY